MFTDAQRLIDPAVRIFPATSHCPLWFKKALSMVVLYMQYYIQILQLTLYPLTFALSPIRACPWRANIKKTTPGEALSGLFVYKRYVLKD